jgi:hypothetical protein
MQFNLAIGVNLMASLNHQTLSGVAGDPPTYFLARPPGGDFIAIGSKVLEKIDLPCNIVMNSSEVIYRQLSMPILSASKTLVASSFTGLNVNDGGGGMVNSAGDPNLSSDYPGPFTAAQSEAIYGVKKAGSIYAIKASAGDTRPGSVDEGSFFFNDFSSNIKIPNKWIGLPYGLEDEYESAYPAMGMMKHNSAGGAKEDQSVTLTSQGLPQIIDKVGRLRVTVSLQADEAGNSPELTIKGMETFRPDENASSPYRPGAPSPSCLPEDEAAKNCYYLEDKICEDRALKAKEAETNRKNACISLEASDPYDSPSRDCGRFDKYDTYDQCLEGCRNGTYTAGTTPWRSKCYDDNYPIIGGRKPDAWHIGKAGFGCGDQIDDAGNYKGCDWEYIVNLVS